jgi:DNA modification methylase
MAENIIKPIPFEGFENLIPTNNLSLADKFGVPPFSVLDTKQGYWQDRKNKWLALGIKSEIGRDAKAYSCNDGMQNRYDYLPDIDTGTSIFDPLLCELMYRWFCPNNGNILDPFAGGSVRGVIASKLGYKYTGIDLSDKQIDENRKQAIDLQCIILPEWIVGDSLMMDELLPSEVYYDFVFSCPPYYDLEKYTDKVEDLSNMTWGRFKQIYRDIIQKSILKLKHNRFACFVVSEIRDDVGYFRGLVPYTIDCFLKGGMYYYNEIILVNVIGTLPIRVNNQFNLARKIGRMHQNILVFYKGDISHISNSMGKIV